MSYFGADGVSRAGCKGRVGSDIGQDGHLVDVGIILGVYVFQFRTQCLIADAGESGISFRHLEEGISFMEVGVVIISWQPVGSCAGDLIGLPCQLVIGALVLSSTEYILIM